MTVLIGRLDVGVFLPWKETSSRHEVVARVHELGWINDASERLV